MHSNHIHPVAEADILTVFKFCAKTFVYSGNDDVFSTVTPFQLVIYFAFTFSRFFNICFAHLGPVSDSFNGNDQYRILGKWN